jgi:hypothetical protein
MSQKMSGDFLQTVHIVCSNAGIMRKLAQDDFMRNIGMDITFSEPQNADPRLVLSNKIFFIVIKRKKESKRRSLLQQNLFKGLSKKAKQAGIKPATIRITYANTVELFTNMRHHVLHGLLGAPPCKAA